MIEHAQFHVFSPIIPLHSIESSRDTTPTYNGMYQLGRWANRRPIIGDPYFAQLQCVMHVKRDHQPREPPSPSAARNDDEFALSLQSIIVSVSLPVPPGFHLKTISCDEETGSCFTWTWTTQIDVLRDISIRSFLFELTAHGAAEGIRDSLLPRSQQGLPDLTSIVTDLRKEGRFIHSQHS